MIRMTPAVRLLVATVFAALAQGAIAKLPPLSDEAKAKAAEAAAKADHSGKVAGFELCKAQDRAAAAYRQKLQTEGKTPNPANEVPPCADPGVQPSPAAAGLEKAGAHSNPAGGSSASVTIPATAPSPTTSQPTPVQKKP
jgi:hypothetical protein